ncbi:MAG: tRNA (N(6)-L-threonylcarbamoyladenosine(37)-C(2))-methylthiotransferase [Nanoarchaeota archaeon]|nr:tRNA (N(6)-L-threonylcarbamoyladenosine(37)-C(2))-methylthiotransferase [Nanoarchaeota archaeon]
MLQIYIETYGCSNNIAESGIMKALLYSHGCSFTNNLDIAEIMIINTCIVKQKTISKIKRRIQDLMPKFDNGRKIIIAGCMPEVLLTEIIKLSSHSSIISTHRIKEISKVVESVLKGKRVVLTGKSNLEKCSLPKIRENKLITIIPISSGCNGSCSYCLARLAKGSLFSYPEDEIIKSIENDLKQGAKEIWLTSQDNASYGLDRGKQELPELLNKVLNLKHNFKLRLGMMNPNNIHQILDKMIEIYKNKKMYKFLHIPIQSASNKIIQDMGRLYNIEQVIEIIQKFRKEFPDITIATDIIVGYPIETEEDHKLNLEFLKTYKPDVFNLSKFSSHKNTKAGKLLVLNKELINKRASELMEMHRKTAMENKQKFKDKIIKVFVNVKVPASGSGTLSMLQNSDKNFGHKKISNNLYESRDDNYNIILIKSSDKSILGKNIDVKVKSIGVHHMIGEVV